MEAMRRSNLFWSLKKGGAGVVNIVIKLRVQRFIYFRDQKDPFLRAAIQVLGSGHLNKWTATSSEIFRRSPGLSFYKEVAEALHFFESRFSWDYLATVKKRKLYWDTIALVLPTPLYRRCQHPKGTEGVLKTVRRLKIPTSSKNLFFRFHWETLPVKTWLKRKNFTVPYTACRDCPEENETILHVFLLCKRAREFWDWFRAFTDCDADLHWTQLQFLDFGRQEDTAAVATLVVLGLHSLWSCRVDREEYRVDAVPPLVRFRQKVMWTLSVLPEDEVDLFWKRISQKLLDGEANCEYQLYGRNYRR